MTSSDSKILMVGLRGSGKTTFLAALWHYLESAEAKDRLEIPALQPHRDYLNSIRNSWLAIKPVGRTSFRAQATVSLALRDKKIGSRIEIVIPDLSGESFRLQWSTRKAPAAYVSFAQECTSTFLFIHPREVKRTHAIKADTDERPNCNDPSPQIAPARTWSPEHTSTQVQLTDLLQLLVRTREVSERMRIAVIVSAWDLI